MSAVQPTDKTLVNRAGVDHSAPADMSTVQDTDLLLINRAGVDYKCTFLDWKNSQTKAPDVGAVTLADVAGGSRFTSVSFPVSVTMTEDGIPASTKGLKAWVEGSLKSSAQTSGIASVAGNVLTLTDNTQLTNFAAGDAVTEVGGGGDATGTVGAVDATANTITLASTAGTWDVGSLVKGPLKTVNKQPNSDVITAVAAATAPTYSAGGDFDNIGGGALDGNLTPPAAGTASGSRTYVGSSNIKPTGGTGTFTPTVTSSTNIILRAVPYGATAAGTATVQAPGGPSHVIPITTGWDWKDYDLGVKSLASLLVTITGNNDANLHIAGFYIDGVWHKNGATHTRLTFATTKDLAKFAAGDAVNQDSGGPASGTVGSTDATAKTMTLATSTGTWTANAGKYVIGPAKPASSVRLYTIHDAAGAVSDLQSADPGYVTMTGNSPYTLTFPATMPTGNAPDVDLPAGTTLTTEIQATSTGSTAVTKTSNTVTPA